MSIQTDSAEPINLLPDATSNQNQKIGEKNKVLYRGVFNLGNEVIIRRTQAVSEKKAKANLLNRIIKEKGLAKGSWIYRLFDGTKDNYSIKIDD